MRLAAPEAVAETFRGGDALALQAVIHEKALNAVLVGPAGFEPTTNPKQPVSFQAIRAALVEFFPLFSLFRNFLETFFAGDRIYSSNADFGTCSLRSAAVP